MRIEKLENKIADLIVILGEEEMNVLVLVDLRVMQGKDKGKCIIEGVIMNDKP